jgi:hypothetical protein
MKGRICAIWNKADAFLSQPSPVRQRICCRLLAAKNVGFPLLTVRETFFFWVSGGTVLECELKASHLLSSSSIT